jgi:YVTN family beta-propeller protein
MRVEGRRGLFRAIAVVVLVAINGLGCTSTRAAIDEADPAPQVTVDAAPSASSTPELETVTTPQPSSRASAPAPQRVALPSNVEPTTVGYSVNLGDHDFMIWGSATSGKMPKALTTTRHGLLISSNMGSDGSRALSVYHSDPLRLKQDVPLEGKAIELALSPDHSKLYVSNDLEWGILQVLDARSFELQRQISVPGFPKWMSVNRAGTRLFASLWQLDGVTEVSLPDGKTRTFRGRKGRVSKNASKNPRGSALSGDERTLFVVNNADQSLSLIDTATLSERKRIRIGYAPRHIVANRDGSRLYISLTGEERVVEFDVRGEQVGRSFRVGRRPKTIALSNDDRFLYSANFIGNSLSIVDLQTERHAELALDLYKPSGLSVRPDDAFIYVSGFCTNDVWAIQRIDPGEAPHLPLGPDRDNDPCLTCFSTFAGCPYPPGTEPKALVEAARAKP